MENSTLATNISIPNSPGYELCLGWKNVRDFSVPLASFGAVLSTLLPFLSVGGSFLLLLIILKFQQLRCIPSNILLASLASSDLLTGLLIQSYHSAMSVCAMTTGESRSFTNIPPAIPNCFASFLVHSCCLNLASMTVERYICIAYSLQYNSIVTDNRVIKAVVVIWVISAALAVTRLIPSFPMTGIRVLQITIISSVLCTIIFCYIKIFRISQRHKRQIISQLQAGTQGPREQEFQSAKTVFIVVVAAISCYSPSLVLQPLLIFIPLDDRVKIVHLFAVTVFLLHSSINPFIIFYRSRKLRFFLKRLFKLSS